MRVCYLASAAELHMQRWVRYIADRKHEVHWISYGPFPGNSIGAERSYVLKKFRPKIRIISALVNLIFSVIQVRRLVKRVKPDILHAHYVTDCGFLGALSGFRPLVIRAMGSDVLVNPQQHSYINILTKYVLRKADLITCHGENLIETIVELGARREKIKVVGLGVETEKFVSLATDKSLTKKELGLYDSPTIICIRGFKPVYDTETLIKAIPLVLERFPDAKFVLAGQGPQEDYIKGLSKSLGVSDSVRFTGWIVHDELPRYLAAADVYVSTSLSDGGPVSTLEAMSCELPVVVTDSGEHRNWVKDGINGFIIPVKSPETLASKIVYLLENKDKRREFGKANRPAAEQIAYYRKEVEKLEKLYQELISV